MMHQPDLFSDDQIAAARRPDFGLREKDPARCCTPAPIGSGPHDQTCGTCVHAARIHRGKKRWIKCALARYGWTRGQGSDIKARWTACRCWRPPGPLPANWLNLTEFSSGKHERADIDRVSLQICGEHFEERGELKNATIFRSLAETDLANFLTPEQRTEAMLERHQTMQTTDPNP